MEESTKHPSTLEEGRAGSGTPGIGTPCSGAPGLGAPGLGTPGVDTAGADALNRDEPTPKAAATNATTPATRNPKAVGISAGRNDEDADVIVIGAGPAGLMAAAAAAALGHRVQVFEAMGSAGRKFLLAGRGGLNLTHTEPKEMFLQRYTLRQAEITDWLEDFDADALRRWVTGLGVETFEGSSGRVFPVGMKAAPLLRAWLADLAKKGVAFNMRHRWTGWDESGRLVFESAQGETHHRAKAVVFALGGASWPRLGSDGVGLTLLAKRGVATHPFEAANCGFDVNWSAFFIDKFAGQPIKNIRATVAVGDAVESAWLSGEAMVSRESIEGGLVYGLSQRLRRALQTQSNAVSLVVDLLPTVALDDVMLRLARGRGAKSWSSFLQSQLGLKGVKTALLRECAPNSAWGEPESLARYIKQLPVRVLQPRPIAQAISSAGGVRFDAMDRTLQCLALPGVFCAGEMIDWEAPTGGYLLTAVMASGLRAGRGAAAFVSQSSATNV